MLLGQVLLMFIALWPARARASEHGNVLRLTLAAPAEESARLEAVTRELLEPLDVTLDVRRVASVDLAEVRQPPPPACFARVWITLFAGGAARLYLEHGPSDRLLVRDVPGDADNPELVREELGHILQAAVESLKAGEEVGQPRGEALQQIPPPAPSVVVPEPRRATPAPRPGGSRWHFGARYELRWAGDGARFEDGPGAAVVFTAGLGVEASGYYRRPLRVERGPVGARLETISLRALVTFEPLRSLRLGAGLGADFVHVTPSASLDQGFELTRPDVRKLAMGRVQATYGYRAWRSLELQLSAGTDLDPSRTRYVFRRGGSDVTVSVPSPLRPFVTLGVAIP